MDKKLFFYLGILVLILLQASCRPKKPNEAWGSFRTGEYSYPCGGYGSPLALVKAGTPNGQSRVWAQTTSVAGSDGVNIQYDSGPKVWAYGGNNISTTPFSDGCVKMPYPDTGPYTFVANFHEGSGACGLSVGECYRFFYMNTIPAGVTQFLGCARGPIFINQPGTSNNQGYFIGPCGPN